MIFQGQNDGCLDPESCPGTYRKPGPHMWLRGHGPIKMWRPLSVTTNLGFDYFFAVIISRNN
jgi:hypothetical protein